MLFLTSKMYCKSKVNVSLGTDCVNFKERIGCNIRIEHRFVKNVSQKYFSKIATSTFSSLISSTTFSISDSVSEGSRMTENNRDPRFPTGVGGVNYTMLDPKLYILSTLNIDLILWHTQLIVCAVKCEIMV